MRVASQRVASLRRHDVILLAPIFCLSVKTSLDNFQKLDVV